MAFKCSICGLAFPNESDVLRHIEAQQSLGDAQHAMAGSSFVRVEATTWSHSSHRLFDREAQDGVYEQNLVVPVRATGRPLSFLRSGNEVVLHQGYSAGERPPTPQGASPLNITLGNNMDDIFNSISIWSNKPKSMSHGLWLKVPAEGHKLQQGDIVRFARLNLRVRQICIEGPKQFPDLSSAGDSGVAPVSDDTSPGGDPAEMRCRICLSANTPTASGTPKMFPDDDMLENQPCTPSGDLVSEEDPLILAPCMCRGSVRRIHLGCLQQWLQMRYKVENRFLKTGRASLPENSGAVAYLFKPPECEICKTEFPATFRPKGTKEPVSLLPDLSHTEPPFIVLEGAKTKDKKAIGGKFVFASGSPGSRAHFGRSNMHAEFIIPDVSLSRVHASLSFDGSDFILQDNGSKFGTLVMANQPTGLPAAGQEPLEIQAGRTLLSFALIESWERQQVAEEAAEATAED